MLELTQKYIQSIFTYRGGELFWKVQKGRRVNIGDVAGSLNSRGYYRIGINGKSYRTHRIIFLYHHGYLPKYIDHIDGNPLNNHIENLREVTPSQNVMNSKSNKNSSSIYKGVSWFKITQKWVAHIKINSKVKHLGYFTSESDAAIAYNNAAIELFGEYANLNKLEE